MAALFGRDASADETRGLLTASPTVFILALAEVVFFALLRAAPEPDAVILKYGLMPARLLHAPISQAPTLLTYVVIQPSWLGLIVSIVCLLTFGRQIEAVLGSARFLFFYLAAAASAALGYVAVSPQSTALLVGDGGATAALFSALILVNRYDASRYLFPSAALLYYLASGWLSLGSAHRGASPEFAMVAGIVTGQVLWRSLLPTHERIATWHATLRLLLRVGAMLQQRQEEQQIPATSSRAPPAFEPTLLRVEQLIVSRLAILETLVAMTVCAFLLFKVGTLHLTIAACIAPLLLLRTPVSSALALSWYSSFKNRRSVIMLLFAAAGAFLWGWAVLVFLVSPLGKSLHPMIRLIIVLSAMAGLMGAAQTVPFKVAATLRCLSKAPLATIAGIPQRWWQMTACSRLLDPPELLPGAARLAQDGKVVDTFLLPHLALKEDLVRARARRRTLFATIRAVLMIPLIITTIVGLTIPALMYRWSLKSTSLVWAPLIWTVRESSHRDPETVIKSQFMSFVRKYVSGAILLLFAAKSLYVAFGLRLSATKTEIDLLQQLHASPLFSRLIGIETFPAWQVALVAAALLDYVLYWYADRLTRHEYTPLEKRALDAGFIARSACAVASIFFAIHLLFTTN